MITGPRTVLLVDHDPLEGRALQDGLGRALTECSVVVVRDAQTAIDYLEAHPVEVLVSELAPPPDDDLTLLAYVRRHHPNLPVVIVSPLPEEEVQAALPQLGAVPILAKPVSPGELAQEVRAARASTVRGRLEDVPLVSVLQVVRLERRTCSLLVRSGERKGRLHFRDGELVDAYAFELDLDGEPAARHVLGWEMVTIDFERSLHNAERKIGTPLETLLLEAATLRDERRRSRRPVADPQTMPDPEVAAEPGAIDASPTRDGSGNPPPAATEVDVGNLQAALDDLRARSRATGELLDALAPLVADVARALPRDPETSDDERRAEARLEAFLQQTVGLAERLAQAASSAGRRSEPS